MTDIPATIPNPADGDAAAEMTERMIDVVANDDGREYLVTAVVHFRVRGTDIPTATQIAKAMFGDELERSELFGDGAVATVLAD